uniref:Uncharacterized protein n=1 Tax=Physcomitrium patens TaxID=3218 RepID=A0A2K1JVA3_PHYPA|nr:hypothetical protein PHYPA_015221 [Physcomitrium patens]
MRLSMFGILYKKVDRNFLYHTCCALRTDYRSQSRYNARQTQICEKIISNCEIRKTLKCKPTPD